MTQKAFVLGLIKDELDRDEELARTAWRQTATNQRKAPLWAILRPVLTKNKRKKATRFFRR